MFYLYFQVTIKKTTEINQISDHIIFAGHHDDSAFIKILWQILKVPANSVHPVSISAKMQPAAHMSMALV